MHYNAVPIRLSFSYHELYILKYFILRSIWHPLNKHRKQGFFLARGGWWISGGLLSVLFLSKYSPDTNVWTRNDWICFISIRLINSKYGPYDMQNISMIHKTVIRPFLWGAEYWRCTNINKIYHFLNCKYIDFNAQKYFIRIHICSLNLSPQKYLPLPTRIVRYRKKT